MDINEFLAENFHVPPEGRINARVAYSDSCHLRHVQKVVVQPRDLIRQIPGVELVELNKPDHCCGSAGVYNLVQTETANEILADKIEDIASTGAEIVVTTNTGCQLQLLSGARRAGLRMRVIHLVELLDQAYKVEE
jgi:glycolate oxidase iron-sulfur subunit